MAGRCNAYTILEQFRAACRTLRLFSRLVADLEAFRAGV